MSITKLALESMGKEKGRGRLAKYAGMLLLALASHTTQAQHTTQNDHSPIVPTEQTTDTTHTTHLADAHHVGQEETKGIHPYGAVQGHYNYEEKHQVGGQFIMGAYGNHAFNSRASLDYNMGFWPLGFDENPPKNSEELNLKKIIYNAYITLRDKKVGNFQLGKVGTIPQFGVKTFRPAAEEDRFMFDEVEIFHIAQGFIGLAYSHGKVPGLTAWAGDLSNKDDSLHLAGGLSYAKDIGNAKFGAIAYAGNHNVTGILNRGENYGKGTKNRYATDIMATFQTPYKPYHIEQKTEEEIDSTGNVTHHTVNETIHHRYTVSGHILGSYYRDISPRMFMIIKLGGEAIATIEGEHVEYDANGRMSCFFTLHPTGDHKFSVSFGGYGQVNQKGHVEFGGGLTFTLGHGNSQY